MKILNDSSKLYFNEHAKETFTEQQKWHFYNYVEVSFTSSYEINGLEEKQIEPKICTKCYVSRKPQYYYWNAYFLIFLINASSFNVFGIDCRFPQSRLQNTFTLLLTSISFKWVINRSLPTVAYLTSLDIYSLANIILLCAAGAWHAVVGSCWDDTFAREIDKWLLIGFAGLFIIVQLLLLIHLFLPYFAIKRLRRKEAEFIKAYFHYTKKKT